MYYFARGTISPLSGSFRSIEPDENRASNIHPLYAPLWRNFPPTSSPHSSPIFPGPVTGVRLTFADWTMRYISDHIEVLSEFPASDFINDKVRTYESIILPADREYVASTVEDGVNKNQPYTNQISPPNAMRGCQMGARARPSYRRRKWAPHARWLHHRHHRANGTRGSHPFR